MLGIYLAVITTTLFGQQPGTAPLTISQAVDRASRNFPSVQASGEQVNAAIAGIRIARTNYLPSFKCAGPDQSRDPQ